MNDAEQRDRPDERGDAGTSSFTAPSSGRVPQEVDPSARPSDQRSFSRRLMLGAAAATSVVVLLYLLRHVGSVLLTAFAGILLAVLLGALTEAVRRRSPLRRRMAWGVVCVALTAVLVGSFWIVGPRMASQVDELGVRIPDAVERIRSQMEAQEWGRVLIQNLPEDVSMASLVSFSGVLSTALGILGSALVVLFVGVYVSFDPSLYRDGLLRLFPPKRRERGREIAYALAHAMRHWLIGRFASMAVVAVLTTVGLILIGFPMALTLGFIAGALSFVPYLGPLVSAVPAVMVGLIEGPTALISVVVLYGLVQLLESYAVTPLIQKKAVSIPPALLILMQVVGGVLYGILGVLLATPITVCFIVITQMIYVEGVLGEEANILGS